jgi:aminoglycoside phosphotransferase (APT) family kinase protein
VRSVEPVAERADVQIALSAGRMGPLLTSALGWTEERGTGRGRWNVIDAKYDPGNACTVLYECGGRMVLGVMRWPHPGPSELADTSATIPSLGMRVWAFPADPAMPGLVQVTSPRGMAAALDEVLPAIVSAGDRAFGCHVDVIRYRPGRRCTLRVRMRPRRGADASGRVVFAKVYHREDKARSVHEEMRALAHADAVRSGALSVAMPLALNAAVPMVIQEPVRGTPLDVFLAPPGGSDGTQGRAERGLTKAATALAALHRSQAVTNRVRPIETELRRMADRCRQVEMIDPDVGRRGGEAVSSLAGMLECLPGWGASLAPIHGDCKPSQFLLDGDRVTVLDFDHFGMSDPASDIGTFLATLRQGAVLRANGGPGGPSRAGMWVRSTQGVFLRAYVRAAGRDDGFQNLARWYEAVALVRKALRAFARAIQSPVPFELFGQAHTVIKPLVEAGRSSITQRQRDDPSGEEGSFVDHVGEGH